jgi:hypothetical protein
MKDEEKDEKLIALLAARRSEAFWNARKAGILAGAGARSGVRRAWLLVPAAAMAALLVLALGRGHRVNLDAPPAVSTAFLENLDLLDDMDVLEAIPDGDL